MGITKGFTLEEVKQQQSPFTLSKEALLHISLGGISKIISLSDLYYLFFKDTLNIGNNTDLESFGISIINGSNNKPGIKYNKNTSKWMYSNDGETWLDIGSVVEFNQEQSDWNETDETKPSFIKNKSELSAIPVIIESYDETTNTAVVTERIRNSDGTYSNGETRTITNADWTK